MWLRSKCSLLQWGARVVAKRLPNRHLLLRTFTTVTAIVAFVGVPCLLYNLYVQSVEMDFFQKEMAGIEFVPINGCIIPHYDPFDASVRRFIYDYDPVTCGRPYPYLTYLDAEGFIHVNETGVREAGLREGDFECSFSPVRRTEGTDDVVTFGEERVFREPTRVTTHFVRARCVRTFSGRLLYETVHAHVPSLAAARLRPSSALHPSVLVVGIESMSRLNFIRQLPKTHELLTKRLGGTVFNGLVKVGDNTYPNMVAMLTGMAARKKPKINVEDWGEKRAHGFFDDLPIVWKNFSEKGYVTMYAEDCPSISVFNYLAKGFQKEPADYYMRPFWLAMNCTTGFTHRDERCYGNFPKYEFFLNYTRDFVVRFRDKRYFAYAFLSCYSHEFVNEPQVLDAPYYAFLDDLLRAGVLNNTVILMLGDHGNRFDSIRATVQGRVEERMPYFAVVLPPGLRTARPHLMDGLRRNRDILISWFDVYEMLADIAMENLEAVPRVARWRQIGTSLFRTVPSRSCTEAGVPSEYCVCVREQALQPTGPRALGAAQHLVAYVNGLLAASDGACAPLALENVVSVHKLIPNEVIARPQGFSVDVRVVVRVKPSQALLEGTLEIDAWTEGRVKGDIMRINKYGNQSHCVNDKTLRLFCYCIDLLSHDGPCSEQECAPSVPDNSAVPLRRPS